jgi:hypothetical protein
MYTIAAVIYGIPITEQMDMWLKEHMDDPDVQTEEFETFGFCVQYSGSANHCCGFLGVELGNFDECDDVRLLPNPAETGVEKMKSLASRAKEFSLAVTDEQKAEVQARCDALPKGLWEVCPPIGIYITWSTS